MTQTNLGTHIGLKKEITRLTGELASAVHSSKVTFLMNACALASAERTAVERSQQIALLMVDLERARALLREWLETPFFETRAGYGAWLADFRPRVEAALRQGAPSAQAAPTHRPEA